MDPNANPNASPNSNCYFAMVDMNKKEIFFMNNVAPSNYGKTFDAASESGGYKMTDDVKVNEDMQNQGLFAMDNDKKFDRYLDDFP